MFIRRFICGLAVVVVMTSTAAAQDTSAQDTPRVVTLGDFLGLRTVQTTVAGQTSGFILDTGGGISVVSPALAEAAGCEPWGQITGFRLTGERLTMPRCDGLALNVDGVSLVSPSAGLFDLSPLLPPDAPRIDGLIALDSLQAQPFTLELGAGRLTFETPASLARRIGGAVEVPIRFHRQAGGASLTVMARVMTPRGALWMQLDSGSDAPILLARTSAEPLGLDPEVARQPLRLSIAGARTGVIEAEVDARVRDMIIDGNIGLPVMRDWIMTFDLKAEKLWITPVA